MDCCRPDLPLPLAGANSKAARPMEKMDTSGEQQLEQRRRQLADDLHFYKTKVQELTSLDPLDFTGLHDIYRNHVARITDLLHVIDAGV